MCRKDEPVEKEKAPADAEKGDQEKKEWKDIIHLPDDLENDVH